MKISNKNYSSTSFGAKFEPKALKEVIEYAANTKQLRKLDAALNNILHANEGDILIIHGKTPDGRVFSNFTMGKRTIQNLTNGAASPQEASFNAILELGELGRKFRSLIGGNVKENITASEIYSRYSK